MREFKIDVLDALQVEKYENALNNVKNAEKPSGSASSIIKQQCEIVRTFFDEVFGSGAGQEKFGESYNYRTHYDEFEKFINQTNGAIVNENKAMAERTAKYSQNRAQRRAK